MSRKDSYKHLLEKFREQTLTGLTVEEIRAKEEKKAHKSNSKEKN